MVPSRSLITRSTALNYAAAALCSMTRTDFPGRATPAGHPRKQCSSLAVPTDCGGKCSNVGRVRELWYGSLKLNAAGG